MLELFWIVVIYGIVILWIIYVPYVPYLKRIVCSIKHYLGDCAIYLAQLLGSGTGSGTGLYDKLMYNRVKPTQKGHKRLYLRKKH